jgi:hypothetical protein
MKSLRPALFALWATFALSASGCRTAGVRDVGRADPFPARTAESATELLAEHNRNAERVQALEAKPSITVNQKGGVSGNLAFERPKNFKLVLKSTVAFGDLADIGSNDKEFWFWVKDLPDKAIYYCNYDESGASPLASSLQPDWVVEAFGLNVIPPEEAEQIKVTPGSVAGTLVLTHQVRERQGQSFIKETVISEATRRIREHRIYSAGKKTLLARAIVYEYSDFTLPGDSVETTEKVFLPKKMRLDWTQEQLSLEVVLSGVKLNPRMTESQRAERFNEPVVKGGYERVNLAGRAGLAGGNPAGARAPEDRTSIRQSMPIPPPRVRLSEPSPLGLLQNAKPDGPPPGFVEADLPARRTRGVEEVIGPQIPTISEPAPNFVQASSGWKTRFAPAVER